MAQAPKIPLQQGANLGSLDLKTEENFQVAMMQEEEIEELEEALDLDPGEAEEEVVELEDGSVVINYRPTEGPTKNPDFYANLAEEFDEDILNALADEFTEYVEIDKESRKERDKQYEDGLRRTGLGKDAPGGAVFEGASKVVHPVMAEACVDFAASSSRELLPPEGVVKSEIKGEADRKRVEIADRKTQFMNWQLTEQVEEYRDEMEQLLTQIPLGGSQYLKWRWDSEQRRPTCEWIPIDNMLLPYAATNFYTSSRATEIQDITEDVYRQRVEQGIYRNIGDIIVSEIDEDQQTRSKVANDKIEGAERPSTNIDGVRRVYEINCFLRLEDDGTTEGKRAPYILTIDDTTKRVLALYRNWESGDEKLTKLDWIVEYKFIPWRGAYAIGLPHLIGGLSAALTGALRALLDAAHINNSQTMLRLKGGRISGQSDKIEPTQVLEIEGAPGVDDVRKLAMPLPFNPPSSVLFNLLGWLTDAAKGVVTTAEEKIGDANANTPVGTTQALIEQGAKVFSSIHARLHRSQAKSLKILSRINHWYLEEMDNQSGTEIEVRDFASNNDIRPVSDPNIFSETQRLAQAQAILQMANSAPQLYNLRAAHRRVLKQLKVPAISEILPDPEGVKEANPALENVAMSMGRPAAAYPDQDHLAHIKVHLAYAQDPNYGGSPLIGPSFAPHALEHIKQHLTLHYLQSMRAYVAQAANGQDIIGLHEEKPLSVEDQKALSLAAEMVSQDAQITFQAAAPMIQQLAQKVQQAQQAKMEQMAAQDPTAQVILKTQMAETQRKSQEAQAKLQQEMSRHQQDYQLKVAELERKVQELLTKFQTEAKINSQKNAKDIVLANINNASKERVADINAGVQMDGLQAQLEHEQAMSAIDAINSADQDIRQHGIEVEQQTYQQEAQAVQNLIEGQKQLALQQQQQINQPPKGAL
jgi:chaperonin GroES